MKALYITAILCAGVLSAHAQTDGKRQQAQPAKEAQQSPQVVKPSDNNTSGERQKATVPSAVPVVPKSISPDSVSAKRKAE